MVQTEFVQQMRDCAELLYQNREQDAYEKIDGLLGEINQVLQGVAGNVAEHMQPIVLGIIDEFVTAYQLKDNLALADFFFYVMPEVLQLINDGAEVS